MSRVSAVLFAAALTACARAGAESARVVHPAQRTIEKTISATGIVRVIDGAEVRVGSRVSGTVSRLNVHVGSQVHRGDLIAEIDPRELQAQLAGARAAAEADAIEWRRAQIALGRGERLAREGIVAASDIDELRATADGDQARYKRDRYQADALATEFDATRIYAPIDGIVSSVSTQQGETVAASFAAPTFITITDPRVLEVSALVDEHDIGAVRPGLEATFNVEAFPTRDYRGRVKRIAPKGTIVSGVVNYEVVIEPEGTTSGLAPDMTATVTIQSGSRTLLELPAHAIRRDGDQNFVLLQTSSGAKRRRVTVGERFGNQIEVRGVTPDDAVIVDEGTGK